MKNLDYFGAGQQERANQARLNASQVHEQYENYLKPYEYEDPTQAWEFWNKTNHHIGYKLHLNAKPNNVVYISNYLKKIGVKHKFLDGMDPEMGKVFTIYSGSKKQTLYIIKLLTNPEISNRLLPPLPTNMTGETHYTNLIAGRFTGDQDIFSPKVAIDGISVLKKSITDRDSAAKKLQELYGEYYGKGISANAISGD